MLIALCSGTVAHCKSVVILFQKRRILFDICQICNGTSILLYYRPRSEAGEGYVFTGVCHSVNSGSLPSEGGLPSGVSALWGGGGLCLLRGSTL